MPLTTEKQGPAPDFIVKSEEIWRMDVSVLSGGSSRRIAGVASTPDIDRENEIILKSAIHDALEFFMQHPIIHLNHSERPIGTVTKATFQGNDLYIEADIYDDDSTTDVWDDILRGTLSQWSIFGRPRAREGQCNVPAGRRTGPCITKALWLDSISLCPGGNAINTRTFATIIKAMTSGSSLVHATADGVGCTKRKEIKKMEEVNDIPPVGPEEGIDEQDPIAQILEILEQIRAVLIPEETEEEAPGEDPLMTAGPEDIMKAETPPTLEERLDALELENKTLRKSIVGKTPYVIPEQLTPEDKKSLGVANIAAFSRR